MRRGAAGEPGVSLKRAYEIDPVSDEPARRATILTVEMTAVEHVSPIAGVAITRRHALLGGGEVVTVVSLRASALGS